MLSRGKPIIIFLIIIACFTAVGVYIWQSEIIKGSQNKVVAQQKIEEATDSLINKQYRKSLIVLDQSLKLDPQNSQIYQNILDIYLEKRQYQLATEILKVAFKNTNNHKVFDPYQVILWQQQGELVKALQLADRLWNKNGDSKYLIVKTNIYLKQKDQSAALETLKLLGEDQYTQQAYLLKILLTPKITSGFQKELSIIKWDQIKQDLSDNQAKILLLIVNDLVKVVKNNDDKNIYYKTYLANQAGRAGFVAWGQVLIDQALEAEFEYYDAWLVKGALQILSEEYEKALESFTKGINLDPRNYHGYWWRATVAQRINDLVQAEKDVKSFLTLGGQNDATMILQDTALLQNQGQDLDKLLTKVLKNKTLSVELTVKAYQELLKLAWQKENQNEVYTFLNKAKLDKRLTVVWTNQDQLIEPLYCEQLHYWVDQSATDKLVESIKKETKSTECGLYYQGILGKKMKTDNWQDWLLQVIETDITGEWGVLANEALVE